MTTSVTIVIAARNEAMNISACIESVRWADEILVVEDGSSDNTVALAEKAGATVIANPFVTIGLQRNVAIERAKSKWILVIDADERASPALAQEVSKVITAPRFDAYRVPRRNFFLGREVRHGGWDSDKPIRLFRSSIRYNESRVHEHVEVSGEVGELESALTHEPYPTLHSWFEKLSRYSEWWAQDRYDRGTRTRIASVIFRPKFRFLSVFILRGGWMDGARGALLAGMASVSVFAKYARLWEKGKR
ncbi:MAG TPA: glycosyltransferase family 2 protein [Gemmatimonadaceae bacterium]|nr:glycosyltransferase family 2 protein [Gemmatimonadaceae bacterium]